MLSKQISLLERFKNTKFPIETINQYLSIIYNEAINRNYIFNKDKIDWNFNPIKIPVTKEQFKYEIEHLLNKLKTRDNQKYKNLVNWAFEVQPMFYLVNGDIEKWEKIK